MATPVSAVITTYNNAATLRSCLESVAWADEILVLDSFSTDDTCRIAEDCSARVVQHAFQGYSKQKQMVIDLAAYDWVLLLDADEAVTSELEQQIREIFRGSPDANGYAIPRIEQLFWKMTHAASRMNCFLRLFDRRKGGMNDVPVHAAPEVQGRVVKLTAGFYHFGEPNIHTKVDKLNSYSTGLVEYKAAKRKNSRPWMCVVYPPFAFLKSYIFKRNFLNGWAGFIGSVCMAFYAFLKYAKLYEHQQHTQAGTGLLPDQHPSRRVKSQQKQVESVAGTESGDLVQRSHQRAA